MKFDKTINTAETQKVLVENLSNEKIDASKVIHYKFTTHAYTAVSPRSFHDMIVCNHFVNENAILNCARSIDVVDESETGYVRAFNHPCGLLVEDLEDEACSKLTLLFCSDINGTTLRIEKKKRN
eukprot:Awhi_evm1s10194